jgi:hypothetical protein
VQHTHTTSQQCPLRTLYTRRGCASTPPHQQKPSPLCSNMVTSTWSWIMSGGGKTGRPGGEQYIGQQWPTTRTTPCTNAVLRQGRHGGRGVFFSNMSHLGNPLSHPCPSNRSQSKKRDVSVTGVSSQLRQLGWWQIHAIGTVYNGLK